MRILAEIADVKELKKAFINNDSITASQVFNKKIQEIDKDMRRKAKAINFGIIKEFLSMVLLNKLEFLMLKLRILNSYFIKFRNKDYMNETIKFCRKSGFVNNILEEELT